MRLITHNMLKCNIRGIENGYPLIIQASATEVVPADFDKGKFYFLYCLEFIVKRIINLLFLLDTIKEMLKRIQWEALRKAAENLSISTLDNIEVITPDLINSEEFLRNIHHLLFEVC